MENNDSANYFEHSIIKAMCIWKHELHVIIKSVGQSILYFDNFYSLILAYIRNIVIYLSFVIIYSNLLKKVAVITLPIQNAMKIVHKTTLR